MATSPPISPTVVTPLAHRVMKRRHSEIAGHPVIDLTGDDEDEVSSQKLATSPTPAHDVSNGKASKQKLEDAEFDGVDLEDRELLEDILDTADLEPYVPDGGVGRPGLTPENIATLRAHLLRVGPVEFIRENLESNAYSASLLGTAFGLPPNYEEHLGEDVFAQVLGHAIIRAFQKRQKLSQYNTIDDAATLLRDSNKIMVITGAGISTSLGIPDFRSKETGFYTKLLEKGINEPEEVFDIYEFDNDPSTFYELAHGILPDEKRHSPTHQFIRLLQDKGKLQTNYTQNIDNLEQSAGIDKARLIQCHGSFATATCRKCGYKVNGTEIFPAIRAQKVALCKRCVEDIASKDAAPKKRRKTTPHRYSSDDESVDDDIPVPGVMKPDITFFGEKLPEDFFERFTKQDAKNVDLVLVIGTSLKVAPVSEMPNHIPPQVPHIYVSREPIVHVNFDVQLLGNCDDVVFELCRLAGWELKHEMIPAEFKVEVGGVEESGSMWTVRPVRDKVEHGAATKAEEVVKDGTVNAGGGEKEN